MSSNLPSLRRLTNIMLTLARIVKDKSTHAIKTYTTDEKHNVERLYPAKNLSEYISEQINFFSEPTLVYPKLYLGNMYNALLWETLVDNNIKYIVNVTDEVTNCFPEHIEYYRIPIKDNNNESMQPYFDESFNKIEEFMNKNDGNVLVHCFKGASRSVTIVTEYLKRKTGKSADTIIQELKAIRPVINPTHQFIRDLNVSESHNIEKSNDTEESKESNNTEKSTESKESNDTGQTIKSCIDKDKERIESSNDNILNFIPKIEPKDDCVASLLPKFWLLELPGI